MSEHWSEYWRQGYITSFGDAFKKNYQGEIKSVWQSFSLSMKERSKILDIGTGNGAVIELIQDVSEHDCIGIDSAKINSSITSNINGCFMSNVSAEEMPFNDEDFDVVISQFALEYSDVKLSIKEISRVLRPRGKIYLVCHVPNSIIVSPNIDILEAGQNVKNNILPELKNFAHTLSKNEHSNLLQKNIEDFIASFDHKARVGLEGTNLPSFYQFLITNKNIDFNKAYSLFESELEQLLLRLNELKRAAINTENILLELKTKNLFSKEVVTNEIRDKSNALLAIIISAEK